MRLIFLILMCLVLAVNVLFRHEATIRTPPGLVNTFAMGNFDDYHQYIMMIKYGREGNLLYHNAYSEEDIPDVLLQPIYPVVGFLTRPFSLSLYDTYHYFRLVSLVVLFVAIYTLILRLFQSGAARILASVFYFSATGLWTVASLHPLLIETNILPYANFDLFFKYLVIPPHHNIAIALLILILLNVSSIHHRKKLPVSALLFALLGLIHPYIQYLLWIFLLVHTMFENIMAKKLFSPHAVDFIIITALAIPIIGYTVYTIGSVLRFSIGAAGILTVLPRAETFLAFVTSLGPLFFLALPAIFMKKTYTKPILRLLLFWAYIPILLFFLPDLHIPFNTWRLFQIYQHIPLALLSAYVIFAVIQRPKIFKITTAVLCLASFLYGAGICSWSYYITLNDPLFLAIGRFMPETEVKLFSYLNKESPDHSVVIAGGIVSNILPSYTHNHVVIGHNGNNRNFLAKEQEIAGFLGGRMPPESVSDFLIKYHARYIIFGIDAIAFDQSNYTSLPYLQKVYEDDGMSVVKVL